MSPIPSLAPGAVWRTAAPPSTSAGKTRRPGAGPWPGVASLLVSFVVGAVAIYLGHFSDEGDNLAVGWLITRGSVLYRDVFSHHFPFPYYWTALSIAVLGRTLLAARLALLFGQTISFAVLMRFTRAYLTLGLAAAAWAAVSHLYAGQMVLYSSLASLALMVVFGLSLALVVGDAKPTLGLLVMLGAYAAVVVLTDPVLALAVGFALAVLVVSRRTRSHFLVAAVVCGLALVAYCAYLALSGTLLDAYRDIYWFNAKVYSRYYSGTPQLWLKSFADNSLKGLNLLRPGSWMPNAEALGLIARFPQPFRWLFSGFLCRLAVLVSAGILLVRRRWSAAALLYGSAVLVLTRSEVYFRQPPIVLISLVSAALVAQHGLIRMWAPVPVLHGRWARASLSWLVQPGLAPIAIVLGLGLVWPLGAGGVSLYKLRHQLSYQANYGEAEAMVADLRRLAAGRDVALGYYPGDPVMYFLSGMPPIAGYAYLWPWVAEIAQDDIIRHLDADPLNIVVLDSDLVIWGRPVAAYAAPLQQYLEANYVKIGPHVYTSMTLAHDP